MVASTIGVVALAGTVVATRGGDPGSHIVTGSVVLFDEDGVDGDAHNCRGDGGFDDIGAGMDVTVRDGDGTIIGSATTRNGSVDELAERMVAFDEADDLADAEDLIDSLEGYTCTVLFDVEVRDADFYEFALGRRGELSETREELERSDWHVAYSIGSP